MPSPFLSPAAPHAAAQPAVTSAGKSTGVLFWADTFQPDHLRCKSYHILHYFSTLRITFGCIFLVFNIYSPHISRGDAFLLLSLKIFSQHHSPTTFTEQILPVWPAIGRTAAKIPLRSANSYTTAVKKHRIMVTFFQFRSVYLNILSSPVPSCLPGAYHSATSRRHAAMPVSSLLRSRLGPILIIITRVRVFLPRLIPDSAQIIKL